MGAPNYVDFRMQEWRMDESPAHIQTCVRRVLGELSAEALLFLKDPRLEVRVVANGGFSVWAFFPIHRSRLIARELKPRPETRILLVFSEASAKCTPRGVFEDEIRDHLGHVLRYLRDPRANNDCSGAMEEWRESIHVEKSAVSSSAKRAKNARRKPAAKGE